jgi:response regulator RpfG family c-di-GMP phosphodiesterase
MMSKDDFLFKDDNQDADSTPQPNSAAPWRVLIVDDDDSIHQITNLVLNHFEFEQRPLQLLHANSATEAAQLIQQYPDIALAIIDVVMETQHAGLDLVKTIRNQLNNQRMRLILRTGQPGEAPEEQVIRDYDINDYKNKTEVTAIKLKTLLYTGLRSYRDMCFIEQHKAGLEKIIGCTTSFLQCSTLREFASLILGQVAFLLGLEREQIYCCAAINSPEQPRLKLDIIASSNPDYSNGLPQDVFDKISQVQHDKQSYYSDDCFIGYFTTHHGSENFLYVSKGGKLEQTDHQLLSYFSHNIAIAYENIRLRESMRESQRELSYILGEAVEKRSKETGSHVKRVANYSYLLAIKCGLSAYEAEKIKLASPLHDLGKIAIPDHILNKPGKHDADEWAIMLQHAELGYQILQHSSNEILQMGAVIAQQHHEKWNGKGYPQRLSGHNIHIAGRITALADVFDALGSDRCYKKAWPLDDIIELIRRERGQQFDPALADILLNNLDAFVAIRDAYPD